MVRKAVAAIKAKVKRKARAKARAKKRRRPELDLRPPRPPKPKPAPGEPAVRMRGAEVMALTARCGEGSHLVHVIRDGAHVKAIITPCGIKAALAGYHLGGDTCGYAILLIRGHISGKATFATRRMREDNNVDEMGHISNVTGGSAAYETRDSWRLRRAQLKHDPSWDRNQLTLPALQKLVAQAGGEGATVTFGENEIRVKVPEHNTESRYLWIVDSWGLGGGPGVPAISSALKRWAKRINEAVARRGQPQRRRA